MTLHSIKKAPPNKTLFSQIITQTLSELLRRRNSIRVKSRPSGASYIIVSFQTIGGYT